MATRRETPDILGSFTEPSPIIQRQRSQDDPPPWAGPGLAPERLSAWLDELAHTLPLCAEVLGRDRVLAWLQGLRERLERRETSTDGRRRLKEEAHHWILHDVGAKAAVLNLEVPGLISSRPYVVDIWACLGSRRSTEGVDLWVECRAGQPATAREVRQLARKAVDVYYAARAQRRDLWFDRLMLLAEGFDPPALEEASRLGVACIVWESGKRPSGRFDWEEKPLWLRKAEEVLEQLQG